MSDFDARARKAADAVRQQIAEHSAPREGNPARNDHPAG